MNNNNFYNINGSYVNTAKIGASDLAKLMTLVYKWMATGLALTAVTSMAIANSETMMQLVFGNSMIFYMLIFGELGLVFYMSSRIGKMSAKNAGLLFYLYSALNGVTLSYIFIVYTQSSIASVFFTTSATFGAISLYGYATKRDLTSFGGFLVMGLFGIIIASVVNIFLQSEALVWMINYIGVFVFIGLTAYDTQKIKHMMVSDPGLTAEGYNKKAIFGALMLYLDFINLFIFLLRILGGRRD